MIRMLVITNNPNRASFRCRIGAYLDFLRRRGIESEIARLPEGILARRRLFASVRHADVVWLHRKMLTAWDGFWLRRSGRKVIFDFDDAVMYADHRPQRDSRLRLRRFGRSVALSHMVIAGNEYLADHARQFNSNIRILPTGLDLEAYRAQVPRENDGRVRLVWIGSRNTLKYLYAIAPALDRLAERLPNVVLRVICDEFFDLKVMQVEKRQWSEATEAADLLTSDIGLAPLPDNRFTRGKCGFKILQYYACGLPVVASAVGVNATYVDDHVTGYWARTDEEWIERIGQLAGDPALRTRMGQKALAKVRDYDAATIGQRLAELILETSRGPHGDNVPAESQAHIEGET
jgi:glycosyltransferase involved in cell wall biosynthesis